MMIWQSKIHIIWMQIELPRDGLIINFKVNADTCGLYIKEVEKKKKRILWHTFYPDAWAQSMKSNPDWKKKEHNCHLMQIKCVLPFGIFEWHINFDAFTCHWYLIKSISIIIFFFSLSDSRRKYCIYYWCRFEMGISKICHIIMSHFKWSAIRSLIFVHVVHSILRGSSKNSSVREWLIRMLFGATHYILDMPFTYAPHFGCIFVPICFSAAKRLEK